jgi:hypothetical protein
MSADGVRKFGVSMGLSSTALMQSLFSDDLERFDFQGDSRFYGLLQPRLYIVGKLGCAHFCAYDIELGMEVPFSKCPEYRSRFLENLTERLRLLSGLGNDDLEQYWISLIDLCNNNDNLLFCDLGKCVFVSATRYHTIGEFDCRRHHGDQESEYSDTSFVNGFGEKFYVTGELRYESSNMPDVTIEWDDGERPDDEEFDNYQYRTDCENPYWQEAKWGGSDFVDERVTFPSHGDLPKGAVRVAAVSLFGQGKCVVVGGSDVFRSETRLAFQCAGYEVGSCSRSYAEIGQLGQGPKFIAAYGRLETGAELSQRAKLGRTVSGGVFDHAYRFFYSALVIAGAIGKWTRRGEIGNGFLTAPEFTRWYDHVRKYYRTLESRPQSWLDEFDICW